MSKSIYKLPYVHKSFFKKNIKKREKFFRIKKNQYLYNNYFVRGTDQKLEKVQKQFIFWKKNSTINKNLLFNKLYIYNGKFVSTFNFNNIHKGFKLGEFCFTRKRPLHKGKRKQAKKVIKKNMKVIRQMNFSMPTKKK